MKSSPLTPEEILLRMEMSDMLELLEDLGLDSNPHTAALLKQTVAELDSLEYALERFMDLRLNSEHEGNAQNQSRAA